MIRSYQGKTPKIHPTAWVSESAYVVGDVEIGEYSSVWPGSVIRGDTIKITLGSYVDIQDNCVLHADRLKEPPKIIPGKLSCLNRRDYRSQGRYKKGEPIGSPFPTLSRSLDLVQRRECGRCHDFGFLFNH